MGSALADRFLNIIRQRIKVLMRAGVCINQLKQVAVFLFHTVHLKGFLFFHSATQDCISSKEAASIASTLCFNSVGREWKYS